MLVTKSSGIVAAILTVALAAACSNSVTGTDSPRRASAAASRDSTGGGTCLTGWIIVDGIATCPGGH